MGDARESSKERPFLVGLLVDVSGSMLSSIRDPSGRSSNRLEALRDALDQLVDRGGRLTRARSERTGEAAPKLFSYGFGFGGPLAFLVGGQGATVRDLLDLPHEESSTVPFDRLAARWEEYRAHVEAMSTEMFGETPMAAALAAASDRIREELQHGGFDDRPVLFVLSDGEPTDASPEEIVGMAQDLKNGGTLLVSCYVTDEDIADPRRLYAKPRPDWPEGAHLMFECSSHLPSDSPFAAYMKEYRWDVETEAKLFTQVNQSDILSEFLNVVLSPIEQAPATHNGVIRVFISYSHRDSKYLEGESLLGFLQGLRNEGFEFWHDKRIATGELWDDRIREEITRTDLVLALVSQSFLNSQYIQNVEVSAFLKARRDAGLVIFPIIVSPCDWKSQEWLAATQFQPRGGGSIERDFRTRGKRDELFLEILREIRTHGQAIRARRK
jgi:TIR domain